MLNIFPEQLLNAILKISIVSSTFIKYLIIAVMSIRANGAIALYDNTPFCQKLTQISISILFYANVLILPWLLCKRAAARNLTKGADGKYIYILSLSNFAQQTNLRINCSYEPPKLANIPFSSHASCKLRMFRVEEISNLREKD